MAVPLVISAEMLGAEGVLARLQEIVTALATWAEEGDRVSKVMRGLSVEIDEVQRAAGGEVNQLNLGMQVRKLQRAGIETTTEAYSDLVRVATSLAELEGGDETQAVEELTSAIITAGRGLRAYGIEVDKSLSLEERQKEAMEQLRARVQTLPPAFKTAGDSVGQAKTALEDFFNVAAGEYAERSAGTFDRILGQMGQALNRLGITARDTGAALAFAIGGYQSFNQEQQQAIFNDPNYRYGHERGVIPFLTDFRRAQAVAGQQATQATWAQRDREQYNREMEELRSFYEDNPQEGMGAQGARRLAEMRAVGSRGQELSRARRRGGGGGGRQRDRMQMGYAPPEGGGMSEAELFGVSEEHLATARGQQAALDASEETLESRRALRQQEKEEAEERRRAFQAGIDERARQIQEEVALEQARVEALREAAKGIGQIAEMGAQLLGFGEAEKLTIKGISETAQSAVEFAAQNYLGGVAHALAAALAFQGASRVRSRTGGKGHGAGASAGGGGGPGGYVGAGGGSRGPSGGANGGVTVIVNAGHVVGERQLGELIFRGVRAGWARGMQFPKGMRDAA